MTKVEELTIKINNLKGEIEEIKKSKSYFTKKEIIKVGKLTNLIKVLEKELEELK